MSEQKLEPAVFPLATVTAIAGFRVFALNNRNGLVKGRVYTVQSVYRNGTVEVMDTAEPTKKLPLLAMDNFVEALPVVKG